MGLGGKLVDTLTSAVAREGACGLHLVTGPNARNVSFYRRQGFTDEVERILPLTGQQDVALLFLGKPL
jgi:ribosomal protein S18 acetylase RimI-like enzyme